jgi:hypothetical protein
MSYLVPQPSNTCPGQSSILDNSIQRLTQWWNLSGVQNLDNSNFRKGQIGRQKKDTTKPSMKHNPITYQIDYARMKDNEEVLKGFGVFHY